MVPFCGYDPSMRTTAVTDEMVDRELAKRPVEVVGPVRTNLTGWTVFWAVLAANLITGVIGGVVAWIVFLLSAE